MTPLHSGPYCHPPRDSWLSLALQGKKSVQGLSMFTWPLVTGVTRCTVLLRWPEGTGGRTLLVLGEELESLPYFSSFLSSQAHSLGKSRQLRVSVLPSSYRRRHGWDTSSFLPVKPTHRNSFLKGDVSKVGLNSRKRGQRRLGKSSNLSRLLTVSCYIRKA